MNEIDAQAMVDVLQAECQQQMVQKLQALAMFATARKRIMELEKQLAEMKCDTPTPPTSAS